MNPAKRRRFSPSTLRSIRRVLLLPSTANADTVSVSKSTEYTYRDTSVGSLLGLDGNVTVATEYSN